MAYVYVLDPSMTQKNISMLLVDGTVTWLDSNINFTDHSFPLTLYNHLIYFQRYWELQ
jgi:hypothetical protein